MRLLAVVVPFALLGACTASKPPTVQPTAGVSAQEPVPPSQPVPSPAPPAASDAPAPDALHYPFRGTDLDRTAGRWTLPEGTVTFRKTTTSENRGTYSIDRVDATLAYTSSSGHSIESKQRSYWEFPEHVELAIDFDTLHFSDRDRDREPELYVRWRVPRPGTRPGQRARGLDLTPYQAFEAGRQLDGNANPAPCVSGILASGLSPALQAEVREVWNRRGGLKVVNNLAAPPELKKPDVVETYRWGRGSSHVLMIARPHPDVRRVLYYQRVDGTWQQRLDELLDARSDGDARIGVEGPRGSTAIDQAVYLTYHVGNVTDMSEVDRRLYLLAGAETRVLVSGRTSDFDKSCSRAELVELALDPASIHLMDLNGECRLRTAWMHDFDGCGHSP